MPRFARNRVKDLPPRGDIIPFTTGMSNYGSLLSACVQVDTKQGHLAYMCEALSAAG